MTLTTWTVLIRVTRPEGLSVTTVFRTVEVKFCVVGVGADDADGFSSVVETGEAFDEVFGAEFNEDVVFPAALAPYEESPPS